MGAEYRVGQEVEVTIRARVAQVVPRSAHAVEMVRLEVEGGLPPLGWVSPEKLPITVVRQPLPTEPGLYALVDEGQDITDPWSTDGLEFHYLNQHGNWVDVGFGAPGVDDAAQLVRWMPLPF